MPGYQIMVKLLPINSAADVAEAHDDYSYWLTVDVPVCVCLQIK